MTSTGKDNLLNLEKANRIRMARRNVRLAVKEDPASAIAYLFTEGPALRTMTVAKFLKMIPGFGPRAIQKTTARIERQDVLVNANTQLGHLTHKQKQLLADEIATKIN